MGIPNQTVTDNGPQFTTSEFEQTDINHTLQAQMVKQSTLYNFQANYAEREGRCAAGLE